MTYIKATLGNEIRKFTIDNTKEFSLEDLKAQIISLFPNLKNESTANLVLLYRDSDGDVITVSSDLELQTAFSHLGDDDTLRIVIRVQAQEDEEMDEEHFGGIFSPFHILGHPYDNYPIFGAHPFHSMFHQLLDHTPSWLDRQRALKVHEEKLRQQRLYEEKMRQARQEQMQAIREKALKEQEEAKKKLAEEGQQVKEIKRRASEQGLMPNFPPGWQVTPFGTWDPVVQETPGYTQRTWGPYGYVACFDPKTTPKEEKEEEKEEEEKEEEAPKEETMEETTTTS